MRKKVAFCRWSWGWWRCHYSELLVPQWVAEEEQVVLAWDCWEEEEAVEVVVEAEEIPLWCHFQRWGQDSQQAPPVTPNPESKRRKR